MSMYIGEKKSHIVYLLFLTLFPLFHTKREKRLIELKFEANLRGLVSYSLSFL